MQERRRKKIAKKRRDEPCFFAEYSEIFLSSAFIPLILFHQTTYSVQPARRNSRHKIQNM